MNKNLSIETRTFPEIWASLTRVEKTLLRDKLYSSGCVNSRQVLHGWYTGRHVPTGAATLETAANVIAKFIHKKVMISTLFDYGQRDNKGAEGD